MSDVSLEKLIESGAHFGHQTRRWNPKMEEYLYGSEEGLHVFDLIKTKALLDEALEVIRKAASEGKKIVLVGTKKQAKEKVVEIGKEAGIFYVSERWLGGTLSNFKQIKKSTQKLKEMRSKRELGQYKDRTKKERVLIDREIDRLERFFEGILELESKPDLMIVIDVKKEKGAVREANVNGLETVGIVDSNSDPTSVTYAVPMNDDAVKALDYVLGLIRDAIMEGKSPKKEKVVKVTKVVDKKPAKVVKSKKLVEKNK